MKKLHLLACALALVAGVAPALEAQRASSQVVKQNAPVPTVPRPSPDMTSSRCSAMVHLQGAALETATRAEQLSHAQRLKRSAIQAQAMASRNDLQTLLKELDATEPSANAEQKAVIASLLIHDREAQQHAADLVTTAQKQTSTGSDIATHARAEIEHLQQAEVALKTDPNTGLVTGQRGSVLCNAQGKRQVVRKPGAPIVRQTGPSTGPASGKRQY